MPAAVLVAAVAAVLASDRVVFVDTARGTVLQSVGLHGEGIGVFAAPDARVVVPLAGEDATAVVAPSGAVERWPGTVFPVFSSDYDRMVVVLPGMLVTLSYPERIPLLRVPLTGVPGARRAAGSPDGRLVAVIPSEPGAAVLVVVAATEGGTARTIELAAEATSVVLSGSGRVAVTGGGTALAAAVLGEARSRPAVDVGGEVRSLCVLPSGRDVLAGLAVGASGEVVGVRVDADANQPLSVRFRTRMPAPVTAVAAAGDDVAAISGESLILLARRGRRIARTVAIPGARDVAFLPQLARSTVPRWSDTPGR